MNVYTYMHMLIDFKVMSEKKFSRLLAGNHCAKVKFIPNLPSPETVKTEQIETVEKSKNFTIPLKGYALPIGYL